MRSTPGLGLFVLATVASAQIMSEITGTYWHWCLVIPGLLVGLWSARFIR